jgi:hypothetical protein
LNDATFTNTGGAAAFDMNGTTSYIRTNAGVSGSGNSSYSQTYCMWAAPNTATGNLLLMTAGWTMNPLAVETSRFRGWTYNNSYMYSSTYTNNQWYYICIVYNASNNTQRLYLNGTMVASSSASYSSSGANNTFYFGYGTGSAGNLGFYTGKIGPIQVYTNKALTDDEIFNNFIVHRSRYGV